VSEPVRVYRLEGAAAADALDWLHVHADVQGARQHRGIGAYGELGAGELLLAY